MPTPRQPQLEHDLSAYDILVKATKATPWHMDWHTLNFTHVGSQIESLLGWSVESWETIEDWADRIHSEDRDHALSVRVTQADAGIDHELEYRALTKDGRTVWVRDVVHVVRERDEVVSLAGFILDVTARKEQETALLRLKRELEALTLRDGLTNVANRRMLEQVLEREWAAARRSEAPLSLVLVDIDYFKQYNEFYGHLKGDECLKRVAHLLSTVVTRPRDLVARFGGEEFAIALPETDAEAAIIIAERCCKVIGEAFMPHEYSSIGKYVSVSAGVGTIVANEHDTPFTLIDLANKSLRNAKQSGRDCVSANASELEAA